VESYILMVKFRSFKLKLCYECGYGINIITNHTTITSKRFYKARAASNKGV